MNNLEQYNELAKSWWAKDSPFASLQRLNEPRFAFFDTFGLNWRNLKVLDAGCGGGFACEFMAKRGSHVFGIDIAEKLVLEAKNHATVEFSSISNLSSTLGFEIPNINYSVQSCEKTNFPDNFFDAVLCVDVLEHVQKPEVALKEFFRVLKPGGVLFFDTINRTLLSKWIVYFFMENISREIPKGTHDFQKFIRPKEMEQFLSLTGFEDIKFSGINLRKFDFKTFSPVLKPGWFKETLYFGKAIKRKN